MLLTKKKQFKLTSLEILCTARSIETKFGDIISSKNKIATSLDQDRTSTTSVPTEFDIVRRPVDRPCLRRRSCPNGNGRLPYRVDRGSDPTLPTSRAPRYPVLDTLDEAARRSPAAQPCLAE